MRDPAVVLAAAACLAAVISCSLLQKVASYNVVSNQQKAGISFDVLKGKRILVVGGSGRVGGSVVTQLVSRGAKTVTVGGTNPDNFQRAQSRWCQLFPHLSDEIQRSTSFVVLDRNDAASVADALVSSSSSSEPNGSADFDLVVHTAGPFQGKVKEPNGILDACLRSDVRVPYIDVCDDYCTASVAKTKFASLAQQQGVPCIISTGCWPGVSSLMAKQLTQHVLAADPKLKPSDLTVDFSFFTAGSGGAGATLLVATFLILAEKALTVVNGRRIPVQAMKEYTAADFGPIVGTKQVGHLNLLETASIHDVLGVGSVSSRFATAPEFWNALLGLMAQLPQSLLADEDLMRKLSIFSLPLVRLVDAFAGATNAMRCDVHAEGSSIKGNLHASALYAHENLEPCVGECVVAFACGLLSGYTQPGVWFTEEAFGDDATAIASVLGLASVGAHTTLASADGLPLLTTEQVWGANTQSVSHAATA